MIRELSMEVLIATDVLPGKSDAARELDHRSAKLPLPIDSGES